MTHLYGIRNTYMYVCVIREYYLSLQYKETSKGPFKYTTLPCINDSSVPQIVNNDVLCPRDNFYIKTQICSTKLTQNGEVTMGTYRGSWGSYYRQGPI